MKKKIEHITCDCCNKEITYVDDDDGDISSHTHFDISRHKKCFEIEDDGYIQESYSDEKMHRLICERCFVKILNQSILGKVFLSKNHKGEACFIY